ncbi:MAG: cytochrome oxidase assembly protein [Candidatus Melainabacteria bacterium HGW-Melainabacteria-1]|nr:MAG: cytochrome oxidase assembly protein [Candidatus Melainabacteria bacterium HGW-Melainabacteria-1]
MSIIRESEPQIIASVRSPRFARFATAVLIYLVLVILWGAWVRITGSGAGCGNHWPDCNGQVIPWEPTQQTLIEFTHRLSSGLTLPLVLIMLVWAWRSFPKGHGVRWACVGTLGFLLSESALGAGLVKFELVADNTSVARAITASLHLINTFTLAGFCALAAWWAQRGYSPNWQLRSRASLVLLPGLAALLLASMSGAITALGDTLFPTTLGAHFAAHPAETHFLVQLRIVHPVLATVAALYLIFVLPGLSESHPQLRGGLRLSLLLGAQLLLGVINVLLAAPGWMQLVHLGMALLVWLACLLFWVQSQELPSTSEMA